MPRTFLLLSIFISFYSDLFAHEHSFVPRDRIYSHKDLKAKIAQRDINDQRLDELYPVDLREITQNLKPGAYIAVGRETGLEIAASSRVTHLLMIDKDPLVVLYNRIKIGLICVSLSPEDLRYLLLEAAHDEWLKRLKNKKIKLLQEVHDALSDVEAFSVFRKGFACDHCGLTHGFYVHSTKDGIEHSNYHFEISQYEKIKFMASKRRISSHLVDINDTALMLEIMDDIRRSKKIDISGIDLANTWQTYSINKLISLLKKVNKKGSLLVLSYGRNGGNERVAFHFDNLLEHIDESTSLADLMDERRLLEGPKIDPDIFGKEITKQEALFFATLDEKRKEIFKSRVLNGFGRKTIEDLSLELGVPLSTLNRWEVNLRRAYERYLETGELPNKYLVIDREIINDFTYSELQNPEDKYILTFRILSTEPEKLEDLEAKLRMPRSTIARREQRIMKKLDLYMSRSDTWHEKNTLINSTKTYCGIFNTDDLDILSDVFIKKVLKYGIDEDALTLLFGEEKALGRSYGLYDHWLENPSSGDNSAYLILVGALYLHKNKNIMRDHYVMIAQGCKMVLGESITEFSGIRIQEISLKYKMGLKIEFLVNQVYKEGVMIKL